MSENSLRVHFVQPSFVKFYFHKNIDHPNGNEMRKLSNFDPREFSANCRTFNFSIEKKDNAVL